MTPAGTFCDDSRDWLRRHHDMTVARNRLQSLIDELENTQAHKRLEPPIVYRTDNSAADDAEWEARQEQRLQAGEGNLAEKYGG
jgi:hypothetical protein